MSDQQQVKVYELAKELGIDSISLLDRLKDLNIKVKNHMSELAADEVAAARTALKKGSGSKSDAPKKAAAPRVRKKAASTEAPAAATQAGPATTAAAAAAASDKAASPNSRVIRRRVNADGTAETTQSFSGGAPAPTSGVLRAGVTEGAVQEVTTIQTEATTEEEVAALQAAGAIEITPEVEVPAAPPSTDAPAAAAAGPVEPAFTRPVAPKRTFLTIVTPTILPQKPMVKPAPTPAGKSGDAKPALRGTSTQDKDGFRVIRMTKENLDQMAEEEAAKKRGGGREAEIRPEDVRFADYRKKEMVFLPKKKKLPVGKDIKKTQITTPGAKKRVVEMGDAISIQDFAAQLQVKAMELVRKLMQQGQMIAITGSIDFDTATLLAQDYQYEVRNVAFKEADVIPEIEDAAETLVNRPPVVTIMGHVDHGKTTLLDSLREANVAAGEAGGITQHIGAYTVEIKGKKITFIDTPGHEAFTVMRARGANVTDIVVLVVAADDGVMPQTREAISHAQAAGVPIIVAVNKIDKPGANMEKAKQALAELNLLAEDWGGQTQFVGVSALKKTNLEQLLEGILLQAEMLELKANPNTEASGTVLEARLDKGRGPVASVLINRGTLRQGDPIVAGPYAGRVKAMMDEKARMITEATPGTAVEVLGLEGVPAAGETFASTQTEADARSVAEHRDATLKAKAQVGAPGKMSLEELFSKIKAGQAKELGVVIKADVFGSVEAVRDSLLKLPSDQVKLKVLLAAPGGITESDVLLASASHAIILGFNVRPETKARELAEAEHIEIRCYSIIYELIEDVKKAMAGLLDKKKVEKYLGRAEVRQTFSVPKIGTIGGCAVVDGKILRGAEVRLLRDSRVIYQGKMTSLKRFKDDAKEVAQGFECGIGLEGYNDLKPGDLIEAFQIELIAPELNA